MIPSRQSEPETPRLLTIDDLRRLFKCGRTTAYARVHEPDFPAPLALSGSAHRWWRHEVLAWLETRRVQRAQGTQATHVHPAGIKQDPEPPPPKPVALRRGGRAT